MRATKFKKNVDLFLKKVMRATKKTSKKNIAGKIFLSLEMNLFFFGIFFLSPEIDCFFSEIGNNQMRALGRKKTCSFLGNARSKSNACAHLKQRKKNIVAIHLKKQYQF